MSSPTWIELAPHHKIGLVVDNPVLLAGGVIGYGEAVHRGVDLSRLGGVVVGPITRQSQRGRLPPRLAETVGGFVLETGGQNRGVSAAVKKFARLWPRLGCPVIAQIADAQPEDARVTAARLQDTEALAGLELSLPRDATPEQLRSLVQAVRRGSDLPLWVKLPLDRAAELASAAEEAGADGLVIGQPPRGAALGWEPGGGGQLVEGNVHGPLAFAAMLRALTRVAALELPLVLIACGGIHTEAQARQALAAGAVALQVDSAAWVEPELPLRLAQALARPGEAGGA